MTNQITYLGDGLYATVVNGQVELRANDPHTPSDVVYLDSYVLNAFLHFVEQLKGASNGTDTAADEPGANATYDD